MTNNNIEGDGWYVMDAFALTMADAYVSGPFATAELADADRVGRNIADDCELLNLAADPRRIKGSIV